MAERGGAKGGAGRRGRPGKGTEDDAALWRQVAGGVRPLRGRKAPPPPSSEAGPEAAPAAAAKPPRPQGPARKPAERMLPRPAPALAPGAAPGLDRRTALRLRRGQLPIEGRIDLHGLRKTEARDALGRFLAEQRAAGRRCVLVITGKGLRGEGAGVLRAALGDWFNEAALRDHILAYAPARARDGGAGAFYVYLRRGDAR